MSPKSKYWYYERSVQSPEAHVHWFREIYRELRGGSDPLSLREDFCGTYSLSCAWTGISPRHSAQAFDLDPEPLAYGKREHWAKLPPSRRKRVQAIRGDVVTARSKPADMIVACNFSFFVLKTRKLLRDYFRSLHRGLNRQGICILEMAGGPGMIETVREPKPVYEGGKRKFTYVWDQREFDPIRSEGKYAIDFILPGGKRLERAFEYDWRLWSIPEVRELLSEAGFKESRVYWELDEGSGEFTFAEAGENAYSWLAYVVGLKS